MKKDDKHWFYDPKKFYLALGSSIALGLVIGLIIVKII